MGRVSSADRTRRGWLQPGLVGFLSIAAFLAIRPWLGCVASTLLIDPEPDMLLMSRFCTFGASFITWPGGGLPGFDGPYYGSLVVGIVCFVAALFTLFVRRPR